MITREELKQTLTESYKGLAEGNIDRMVDNYIEEQHGADYEKHLQEYGEQQAEAQRGLLDEQEFKSVEESIYDDENIVNYEAGAVYELEKASLMTRGYSEEAAHFQVLSNVKSQFGKSMYDEVKSDESKRFDADIKAVAAAGFEEINEYASQVKALMKSQGLSALRAFKEIIERKAKENNQLEKMAAADREYYEALDPINQRTFKTLQQIQPDSNWTAEKYYKSMVGNKPLPKKLDPGPEETVSMELYLKEKREVERMERLLANGR